MDFAICECAAIEIPAHAAQRLDDEALEMGPFESMNAKADADQNAVVLENVIKATGLSRQEAKDLLLINDDALDGMCDAALSDVVEATANFQRLSRRAATSFDVRR